MAKGVWGTEAGQGAAGEGLGEEEHAVEPAGGGAFLGEAGFAGRGAGKPLRPERRRAVEHARKEFEPKERDTCRLLGLGEGRNATPGHAQLGRALLQWRFALKREPFAPFSLAKQRSQRDKIDKDG